MGLKRVLMGLRRFDGTAPVFRANPADQGVSKSTLNRPRNQEESQSVAGVAGDRRQATDSRRQKRELARQPARQPATPLHQARRWVASGESVRAAGSQVVGEN